MTTDAVALGMVALLGAAVGSFLNVCILRLPARGSVVWPASRCPACARALPWYENIPVLSWVLLRARCAGCGVRISVMYPLVEIATALTFAAAWMVFGPSPLLVVRLLFASAMIVLAVTDLRDRLLPNAITLPGIAVGLLASLFLPPGFTSALIGAVAGGGVPFLVGEAFYRIRGIEGLGMGDVKMLAMIGAFLGWPLALMTLFIASMAGVAVGVPLTVLKRDRYYQIPLGTFLALGGLLAAFVGPQVLDWYLGFYQ